MDLMAQAGEQRFWVKVWVLATNSRCSLPPFPDTLPPSGFQLFFFSNSLLFSDPFSFKLFSFFWFYNAYHTDKTVPTLHWQLKKTR